MVIEEITNFAKDYWWAIALALGIIVIAYLARKGLIGARLKSLFSWPPEP